MGNIDIITRCYYKDEKQLITNLIKTFDLFHCNINCNLNVVLDEETEADRTMGTKLIENKLVDNIHYEKLPNDWKELFQGISFQGVYGRWGYDRQQWSTFYFDKYSDKNIIGVVDSDSTFFSYVRPKDIFFENKIKLHVVLPKINHFNNTLSKMAKNYGEGDHYKNDKTVLKIDTPYEYMYTNRMPIFFYKETFENCRNYISKRWNMSFDEAFKIFSRDEYSQFNILVNYALTFESDKYHAIFNDKEFTETNNIISVGQNGCLRPYDIITGYIQSFDINVNDLPENYRALCEKYTNNIEHVNRYSNSIIKIVNKPIITKHYKSVQKETKIISYDLALKNFINFLENDYENILSQNLL